MKPALDDRGSVEGDPLVIPLPEARRIIYDPAKRVASTRNFIEFVLASHTICESSEATLQDLFACASSPFRSAAWRPTHLLHERTGVPKSFDQHSFIIIDVDFWRDFLSSFPPEPE